MKIALVCDWLTGMRGGERCLEAVCELYPDADIFTLVYFPGTVSKTIKSHKIRTSYIQKIPGDKTKFRRYLPLFPNAVQKFDLNKYDCIISFSHCVAKGIKPPPHIPHICYCYTPMRYAWYMRDEYLSKFSYLKKLAATCLLGYLRSWDRNISSRITHFIAISKNVQNRIKQAYNRDSVIIYPPVDCSRFAASKDDDGYYLVFSALVPYKRIDLAVKAFNTLDHKLLIVGNGPELSHLKDIASANISFVESATDNEVVQYMQKCKALIFPGEEDFGIVPLEVQACGKPVIAFGKGGALETVIGLDQTHNTQTDATGIFFYEQSPQALRDAISLFEEKRHHFDAKKCRENALGFDRPLYKSAMKEYVEKVIQGY